MFPVNHLFLDRIYSQLRIKVYRIVFGKFLDGRSSYCKSNLPKSWKIISISAVICVLIQIQNLGESACFHC